MAACSNLENVYSLRMVDTWQELISSHEKKKKLKEFGILIDYKDGKIYSGGEIG